MADQIRKPRLDTIIKAISEGLFDENLTEIRDAITGRDIHRKNQVQKLIEEVYGPGYSIRPAGAGSDYVPDLPQEAQTTQSNLIDQVSEKEKQMESDIENRGAIVGGIGPGQIGD